MGRARGSKLLPYRSPRCEVIRTVYSMLAWKTFVRSSLLLSGLYSSITSPRRDVIEYVASDQCLSYAPSQISFQFIPTAETYVLSVILEKERPSLVARSMRCSGLRGDAFASHTPSGDTAIRFPEPLVIDDDHCPCSISKRLKWLCFTECET